MNTLLIYFAFPVAVIIFSIILEKLLNNPIAVASLIFAIFIVITFAVFDETFLIATLAYTIIALLTALMVGLLKRKNKENCDICSTLADLLQNNINGEGNNNNETIEDLLENCGSNNQNSNSCSCGRYRTRRR